MGEYVVAENEMGSVIDAMRRVPRLDALISFTLSLGYPLQFWLFYSYPGKARPWARFALRAAGFVLTIVALPYLVSRLVAHVGGTQWYTTIPIGVLLTFPLNFIFFLVVLAFDLHNLLYVKFLAAGKASASEWVAPMLGHKLWSGQNTYRFLEHLLKESPALGRAKWLLVGFLCADIDRKIQRDPDQKADSDGNLGDTLKSVHPIYKITVHDWSARTYSRFLAENMTYAKRTINWVVDPVDLLTEIIPAHVLEVIISLGSIIRGDVTKKITEAKQALDDQSLSTNWGALLGSYAKWCPRPHTKPTDPSTCKRQHGSCPESFPFVNESRHRQLDHLWYAVFARTLVDLQGTIVDHGTIKNVAGRKKGISWETVRSAYRQREAIVGSLVLPHIDEFRKAACSKNRHIYLGLKPENLNDEGERIQKGIDNLRFHISGSGDYVGCISPQPTGPQSENGLFSMLLCHDLDDSRKITLRQPSGDADVWSPLDPDVKKLILRWSINLLAYTSGGEKFVQGVFVRDSPTDPVCRGYHDIGFYDGLLVLSSGCGRNRDVTWRVYQESPRLERVYFPPPDSDLCVPFDELVNIITGAASAAPLGVT